MLTNQERQQIEQEIALYPDPKAAAVEALKIVQRHRGWIDDASLQAVAALIPMSPEELEGLATYHNLIFRRPVGRHVILLCDSAACWIMDYEKIRQRLKDLLGIGFGETTKDNRFTLLPMACLGACDRAPTMLVDWELHTHLDPETLLQILERYD